LTQADDFQFYRDQLWTAPELLRMTTRPVNGTHKADVYSFAVVLQELMFRAEPYFIESDPPRGMNRSLNFVFYGIHRPIKAARCMSLGLYVSLVLYLIIRTTQAQSAQRSPAKVYQKMFLG